MPKYSAVAWERAMKVQEVILRAMARKIRWWQAGEIIGLSDRSMRRWRQRYVEHGYDGLLDRRWGKPSPQRVPLAQAEEVLRLYQEKYADLNVRHFHEKLQEAHGIELSYTWVKLALQGAGLVKKGRKRGVHRKRRARRPLPGMLLHLDGSRHQWFQDERWYDLIEIVDDASSETYYAQLVEEESTRTVMTALREVIERKGRFCALYSDRASHFFHTPAAGGPVSRERLSQVGRALQGLGAQRAAVWHLARALAAGVAFGPNHRSGGSQPVSAGALHRGDEPEVQRAGHPERTCVYAGARPGLGSHLFGSARARRSPGQHRAAGGSGLADRAHVLARHAGRLARDDLRTLGWPRHHCPPTPRGGAL